MQKIRVIPDAVWESFLRVSSGVESPAGPSEIAHNSSDVNNPLEGVRVREMKDNYSKPWRATLKVNRICQILLKAAVGCRSGPY